MKKSDIVKNLDEAAKLRGVIESYQQEQNDLVERALRIDTEVFARWVEIKQALDVLMERNSVLIKILVEEVLKGKVSVKGEKLQAIFSAGRQTWDTKALGGYALAHPELEKLKKVGKPSVSIREVKAVTSAGDKNDY